MENTKGQADELRKEIIERSDKIKDGIDNKPLDPVFIGNIQRFMDEVDIPKDQQILFRDGAQYGFNLRDVFCEDLKKDVTLLSARVKELEEYETMHKSNRHLMGPKAGTYFDRTNSADEFKYGALNNGQVKPAKLATCGRIVHYFPHDDDEIAQKNPQYCNGKFAAIILCDETDPTANLQVFCQVGGGVKWSVMHKSIAPKFPGTDTPQKPYWDWPEIK